MDTDLFFPLDKPFEIAYRKDSPKEPIGPHTHNGVEIYYTLTTLPDVLLEDQVFNVPAGTMIIIPPYSVHQLYHELGVTYERYVLNIKDSWLKNLITDAVNIPLCLSQKTEPIIMQSSECIFKKLLISSQKKEPIALAHLFELISFIKEKTGETKAAPALKAVSESQKKVNEIIAYIEQNIRNPLSVNDISAHFYLHPDYLGRLFRQHAHVTLGHFITLQRIALAQEMLRSGSTVQEVSDELGFSSYAYFFKTFQKTAGISPSRYRALYTTS